MEKYGFVYIWFDRKHKRYYIGCHWGNVNDGYICSSSWMKKAYKYRPQDFKRRILKTNINKEELLQEEYHFLKLIKKEELGIRYYNLRNNLWESWSLGKKFTTEHKSKLSKAKVGKKSNSKGKSRSAESKEKNRQSHIGKSTGVCTEERKQKLREINLGKKLSQETIDKIKKAKKGFLHSEESKEKIRQSHLLISNSGRFIKGVKKGKQEIITCIYCNVVGGKSVMNRYHFNNCKQKKKEYDGTRNS